MYSSEQVTLSQYLNLPESVLNLRFSHYYFYPNTLVNLKTHVGFKNLMVDTSKSLSEQIQHEIIIPDNIPEGKEITILEIMHYNIRIYKEVLKQNYIEGMVHKGMKYSVPILPRSYKIHWALHGVLNDYNQIVDHRFNTVNTKGDKIDTSNWHTF